ncbi:MAG: amidophosphoribosyltransferase [Alphaproteobacteria bacterium]|jgi:amidophosphoribosyltransferase|nr:amidophosphoribosyltransferase [Alphaproteobacteria bacterium]
MSRPLWTQWFDDQPEGEDADRLRDECGVFGVFGCSDHASPYVALGLHALQHRGQEGCGIISFDGEAFWHERHQGMVGDNFGGDDLTRRMPGPHALGHTRYATQGGRQLRNVQPLYADISGGGFAIAHNGNLTNARALREALVEDGAIFQSTSDTECVVQLVAQSRRLGVVDRFVAALHQIEGAYALVCLTNDLMIAARDPLGIRPLVVGELDGAVVFASETCALNMIGASFVRKVENGEVIVARLGVDGRPVTESYFPWGRRPSRPCVFEFIYFSRPDSVVDGRSVYEVRKRMGQRLAQETGVEADVVVAVPDSGVPAALGYSLESRLPYEMGIFRATSVGRTFIQPKQEIRDLKVRLKHSINRAVVDGKRVVLVDDSIVRGTTSRQLVQMVKAAGAREVHFRSASPPIRHPDFYGIDMPTERELMAANLTEGEMRKSLEVDTLGFLSVEGLYWALGEERRNAAIPQFSDHCFTADYPTRLVDRDAKRAAKEFQASLLGETAHG